MKPEDREPFFNLLADVYAFYRRDFSTFAGSVWWTALRPYDLAAVSDAIGRHSVNPDAGHFMPMPADIVKMMQGSTQDSALVAWSKVDKGVRQVGTYASVVFDDALIHRVLHDMGGWVALGAKTDHEWPFIAKEFENRYRGYRIRSETPEYPKVLIGIAQAQNDEKGKESQPPVLIGDSARAKQVMLGGADQVLLGFQRMQPADMVLLETQRSVA